MHRIYAWQCLECHDTLLWSSYEYPKIVAGPWAPYGIIKKKKKKKCFINQMTCILSIHVVVRIKLLLTYDEYVIIDYLHLWIVNHQSIIKSSHANVFDNRISSQEIGIGSMHRIIVPPLILRLGKNVLKCNSKYLQVTGHLQSQNYFALTTKSGTYDHSWKWLASKNVFNEGTFKCTNTEMVQNSRVKTW